MTLEVLIVGLGRIGMGYDLSLDPAACVYTHARAFSGHPAFRLVGGVDAQESRRVQFEDSYACPAYSSLDAALGRHRPDVVVISVPTEAHASVLEQVLAKSRPRIVLCEKPLSHEADEAARMVDACAARGVALYVNYMRRSDPAVIEVRRRIEAGALGQPFKAVVWYSKGLLHNGSHFLNLLELWLGRVVQASVLDAGRELAGDDREPDARIVFERGSAVFLAAWEEAYSHYTIEIVTPAGRLRYEEEGRRVEWQGLRADPEFSGYTVLDSRPELIPTGFHRYQWHVADQLARAARGIPAHLCGGADALRTLSSINDLLTQARQ